MDHMQISISSHQQKGNSLIVKDNEPTAEDLKLQEVLARVSPEYLLRSGRSKEDQAVLLSVVPQIKKKAREPIASKEKALTLACRRKKSILEL